ncbi:MAG TPA: cyclase family protein [Bryobacteraceae bacterium]|nr:cyclase family protein [Bryobacteraceae bacterium]
MKVFAIGLILLAAGVSIPHAQNTTNARPAIANEADFRRAMKELSNWGRWGADDELGAANLITPAKRKQALALAKEGVTVSLAHDVAQEKAPDAPNILERTLGNVTPTGTTDRYQYTGTYHGVIHSHLDAVDCHIMSEGKGYNGRSMEDIVAAGGCPKGNINVLKDGVVTRAILFDATRLPGKATAQGWLDPGTAIHRDDLEALEKLEHVKVAPGDVILLYTGRWKRRAALGPWPNATGFAGYHADVAYFIKERGVSFIGCDGPNDVTPSGLPQTIGIPLHQLALVAMGVSIFDNLDFERAIEQARQRNRYEFLFMAAPLRIEKGTGSPLNPLAVF